MKNLGKTIDKIIKIEPSLEARLTSIKVKWERYPQKNIYYWKQFLDILNTEIPVQHPKRIEIQNAVVPSKKTEKTPCHTFEEPTLAETVVGIIPENLEGLIRKYDRQQIELAKKGVVARMTHDAGAMLEVIRATEFLEIKQRKLWADLKDQFKFWSSEGPTTFLVRKKGPMLILTSVQLPQPQQHIPPPPTGGEAMPETFVIRMDPDILKKFFKYFNLTPPPGMFPE